MLPPDRVATGSSGRARMSKRSIRSPCVLADPALVDASARGGSRRDAPGRGCRRPTGRRSGSRAGPPGCARPGRLIIRVGSAPASSTPSTATDPRVGSRMPESTSTSSVWPLPETPATPRISPAGDVERHLRERRAARAARRVEAADAEHRRPGGAGHRRTFDAEGGPADHHAASSRSSVAAGNRPDQPAAAEDADPVADGTHLRQLVADEDDRQPIGHQRAQRGEERVRPRQARAPRSARRGSGSGSRERAP